MATTLILATCWCTAAEERKDIKQLYKELDATIDSVDIYEARKQESIDFLRAQLNKSHDDAFRYQMALRLYREYESYVCDSALAYARLSADIARRMDRSDLLAQSIIEMATELAKTGFYSEALTHFDRVPRQGLQGELLSNYYWGLGYLYGEMGFYSKDETLKKNYLQRQQLYTDSMMNVVSKSSWRYYSIQMALLNEQGKNQEAMAYSNQWLKNARPGSHDYAIMAYFRSEIYKNLHDEPMQHYWLIQSAIADIRNSVMDQASLISLANSLGRGGEAEKAYRYMEFSWNCISRFSPHMRSWLVTPILTMIKDQHEQKLAKANNRLLMLVGLISALLLTMAALYGSVVRKRRQLAKARDELKASNHSLTALNGELQHLNRKLSDANLHLHDANRIKEQGITQFLRLCSQGVDKLEAFRITINRKLRVNQYAELVKMTDSGEMKDIEVNELFDHFDEIILSIFPTFVQDFNNLLKPEARTYPLREGSLNTILRIFALIRMGIEDGTDIAEFLRCSPNSVYTYRSRIKRNAICRHDEFEEKVKEIGLLRCPQPHAYSPFVSVSERMVPLTDDTDSHRYFFH